VGTSFINLWNNNGRYYKKPITYWFKAMWWITTRKSGINAVNLKELLGLGGYGTS